MTKQHITAIFFSLLAVGTSVAEDGLAKSQYAASLMEVLLANNACIESFDVLIRAEKFSDRPDVASDSSNWVIREIKDAERNRYLMVRSVEKEDFRTNEHTLKFLAASFGRDCPFEMTNGTGKRTRRQASVLGAMRQAGWADFGLLGTVSFLNGVTLDSPGIRDTVEKYTTPSSGITTLSVNARTALIGREVVNPVGAKVEEIWNFDTDRSVPLSFKMTFLYPDRPRFTKVSTAFKWHDADGVFVPLEIHRETAQFYRSDGGEITQYTEYDDFYFHWFDVNHSPEEQDTSLERSKSIHSIREMLAIPEEA